MKRTIENIKNIAFSDYRSRIPGIICDIIDCQQYVGFSSVLKVKPTGYSGISTGSNEKIKSYNVVCCGSTGVYGFSTSIKESFFAYVITDNPSLIEGLPAILIPKTFLMRNPGIDYDTNEDVIDKEELKKLVMRKENLIVSRKYS